METIDPMDSRRMAWMATHLLRINFRNAFFEFDYHNDCGIVQKLVPFKQAFDELHTDSKTPDDASEFATDILRKFIDNAMDDHSLPKEPEKHTLE